MTTMKPRVLILHAPGTNRDREAALACERAGGQAQIVHINELSAAPDRLDDFQMLVLPGGFSFGDDLGAGKLWALELRYPTSIEATSTPWGTDNKGNPVSYPLASQIVYHFPQRGKLPPVKQIGRAHV